MPSFHKPEKKPRADLKAKLTARQIKFARFARERGINVKTLYAVLDGYRTNGPEARRIIAAIRAA